jgi:hypothetical protein
MTSSRPPVAASAVGSRPFDERLTAGDYALLALLRLGGASQDVDIEDIAIEAHRIAPNLFSWRRHPEVPSTEAVRISFRNLESAHRSRYVISPRGHERMLTAEGIRRAQEVAGMLGQRGESAASGDALRRPIHRDLVRMLNHPAYLNWKANGTDQLDRLDLGDLVHVVSGSPSAAYSEALLRAQAQATDAGQAELVTFLGDCLLHLDDILARKTI